MGVPAVGAGLLAVQGARPGGRRLHPGRRRAGGESVGELHLSRLEAAPLPEGFKAVHDGVQAMMPRIDYPELLLETHGRTGMFDFMEHISGSPLRRDDLDISLAAYLV
jgi:hypothetical protein